MMVANRTAVPKGCTLLLPRHAVYFFAPLDLRPRFKDVFSLTWRRLPLDVRRRLLRKWRERRRGEPSLPEYLVPKFLVGSATLMTRDKDKNTAARYTDAFTEFLFVDFFVERLSDEALAALIAHELAHCFLDHGPECGMEKWVREVEVFEALSEWGFEEDVFDDECTRLNVEYDALMVK